MTTFVDRYVSAAVERVPEQHRTEVAAEIRTAIDEMVEQRVTADEPETQAIEQVLNELGDPVKFGASYLDRPRYLIGPGWYPTYLSAIKLLLMIVLPLITLISLFQSIGIEHEPVGSVIGDAVESVIEAGIWILFWVTVVFVIAERSVGPEMPAKAKRTSSWTVAELPEAPSAGRVTLGDALPAVIGLIVFGVLAVAQARSGIGFFVRGASDSTASLPLINPDLAPGWQIGFFALLALSLVIEIVRYVRGFWTRSMLLLALVEGILWIVYVIALALRAPIVNPDLGRRISEGSD